MKKLWAGALTYLLIVFPFAIVWHLLVFKSVYDRIGYFNGGDPIFALGFAAILTQGFVLAFLYPRVTRHEQPWAGAFKFGLASGFFLWSSQVLAVTAKHQVSGSGEYVFIESFYFMAQFALIGVAFRYLYATDRQRPDVDAGRSLKPA